ncbi:PACE efflux transporter [Paroceanicella profunda]|uniref:PACE efflux transporter n=1 Tax=Paroceanicella profunda TaxID=2579971 RepID=A0A5B8FWN7_9RHOB|nr:PACE efflux transporter [Paroceanicella profunda]QDL91590.1 PACE efflux transporter [Paroceanicella profunda]
MRSTSDRLRHAISFELLGLALVTPLGALAFERPLHEIGLIAVVSAALATAWNYLFNLGFDHALRRLTGALRKPVWLRLVHAVVFEIGLLAVLMPYIAWQLGISLLEALTMDIAFAAFYMVFAFAFNWAYDALFPVPDTQRR